MKHYHRICASNPECDVRDMVPDFWFLFHTKNWDKCQHSSFVNLSWPKHCGCTHSPVTLFLQQHKQASAARSNSKSRGMPIPRPKPRMSSSGLSSFWSLSVIIIIIIIITTTTVINVCHLLLIFTVCQISYYLQDGFFTEYTGLHFIHISRAITNTPVPSVGVGTEGGMDTDCLLGLALI